MRIFNKTIGLVGTLHLFLVKPFVTGGAHHLDQIDQIDQTTNH